MKENNQLSPKAITGVVMILIYLAVAYLLVFTKIFDHVALSGRAGIAAIFFVYGLFRAYRVWKNL